jgi:Tfp pilus assembly protein PilF
MPHLQNSSQASMITGYNCSTMSASFEGTDENSVKYWAAKAVSYYKASLNVLPSMTVDYYLLGNIYRYGYKDFDSAEQYYKTAYQESPGMPGLSRQMAGLYFTRKEFERAVPFYEAAVKQDSANADLLFHQAMNSYMAGNTEAFLQLNKRLFEKFPDTQYPYLNYGTYYFKENDWAKMSENFEKAVQYGCRDPKVLATLIKYFSMTGNHGKVQQYRQLQSASTF